MPKPALSSCSVHESGILSACSGSCGSSSSPPPSLQEGNIVTTHKFSPVHRKKNLKLASSPRQQQRPAVDLSCFRETLLLRVLRPALAVDTRRIQLTGRVVRSSGLRTFIRRFQYRSAALTWVQCFWRPANSGRPGVELALAGSSAVFAP